MSGLSVIIPSRNASNLVPCVEAVWKHDPNARIFVINDGLEKHPALAYPVEYVRGIKPFVFARNCNLGIQAAGNDDVILLNDDALLETQGGFTAMQWAASLSPQFGLVSATTNLAGNPEQMRRPLVPGGWIRRCPKTPGNSFPTVAFVCVLIPRSTIDMVRAFEGTLQQNRRVVGPGPLDQRFTAYGYDDNDLCRRVHLAGLHVGICDGCFVDHAKLHSTFRGDAYASGSIDAGKQIYLAKWGTL